MTRSLLSATLAIVALAVAAACGGSGSPSGSSSSSGSSGSSASAQTVTFTESEFKIDPASSTLKAGTYTFQVDNKGSLQHDLHIATADGTELGHSPLVSGGQTASFQVTLKAGTYTIWCNVPGHRARGMEGTVTVS